MIRRRVLFVQHTAAPSGSAVSLGLLINALDRERYEPIMACTCPTPALQDYYGHLGIPVVTADRVRSFPHTTGGWYRLWNPAHAGRLLIAGLKFPSSVKAAQALFKEFRPDIVHLNSVVLVPAAIAAHRLGIPLVWHVRESVVDGHLGLRRRWISRQLLTRPNAVIFLSASDMERLGSSHRWHVIPNSVDFSELGEAVSKPDARGRLEIPVDAKVVLFLGGYSPIKGPTVLLRSLPQVAAAIPGLHCLFVGAHAQSKEFVPRLARRLLPLIGLATPSQRVQYELSRIRTPVTILGWRDDINDLFAASDVLAVPSTQPHFSRPTIEAAARRVPVVGSRLGGVSDLVDDGITGRLVDPNSPEALASALIEVLADEQHASALAGAAFERAIQRFDQEAQVRKITELYDAILSERTNDTATV